MTTSAHCTPQTERLSFLGRPAGTQGAAAAAKADAQAPAWVAMSAIERATWMQTTILQAVNTTLCRTVGLEEPLMMAGLDSLGKIVTFALDSESSTILFTTAGIQALPCALGAYYSLFRLGTQYACAESA